MVTFFFCPFISSVHVAIMNLRLNQTQGRNEKDLALLWLVSPASIWPTNHKILNYHK